MTWTPTVEQRAAVLDPDVDNLHEAETRVRAALRMIDCWRRTRNPALLDAVGDLVASAKWYALGEEP